MPVVELNHNRLQKLVGGKSNKKKIIEQLPYLGLDIEGETKNEIRIEYSPNRPDYSTDYGIALGLQGQLGIKKGIINLNFKKKSNYQIKVESSVSKIRPYVTGIIAKNGHIDDNAIEQLIVMQEDLHFGIGRKRKKSSIGIHDLDKISFPLKYTTTGKNSKFIPLNSKKENSIDEILKNSEVGKDYGHILGNSLKVPIIIDSKDNVVSFPPIINASITTVTTKTKNLFVEVTGLNKTDVEDMLSVVATILQSAGFELHPIKISGTKNSTPLFKSRKIVIDPIIVQTTLGINLSSSEICNSLKKCRIDAKARGKKIECVVPRYRFDIFGPMDLVEEIALGYGIENMKPTLSPSQTLGNSNPLSLKLQSLSSLMTGLGFMEVVNSSLTNKSILYELSNRDSSNHYSVLNSKSEGHDVLRDNILTGLIINLSNNIHEPYPQKLFETGTVFSKGNPINETIHLACIDAHKNANFSEIKSILQSLLKTGFNIEFNTKTSSHAPFHKGRTADVIVNGKPCGIIGEIDSKIKENFKIRVPLVGFEIKLTGLIFN